MLDIKFALNSLHSLIGCVLGFSRLPFFLISIVADDFALERIKEFRVLPPLDAESVSSASEAKDDAARQAQARANAERIFAAHQSNGNPFGKAALAKAAEAARVARAKTAEEEAAAAAVAVAEARAADKAAAAGAGEASDEANGAADDTRLFVTSTSINVAKFIGKYMQMMITLEPIAYQVFVGIAQLFDFYLFAVHSFFIESVQVPAALADLDALQSSALQPELRQAIDGMRDRLDALARAGMPLKPEVDSNVASRLADANGLCGAAQRAVACEVFFFFFVLSIEKKVKQSLIRCLLHV